MKTTFSPIKISILIHAGLVLVCGAVFLILRASNKSVQTIPLKVIENAQSFSTTLKLQPPKPMVEEAPPPPPQPETKKVFGVSRKAITATGTAAETAISVKEGNTVAKEQDNLKLEEGDADSLPIPADDFLITQDVVNIARPKNQNRTDEARAQGFTGVVSVQVLIDQTGIVREARALNQLPYGLSERAVELVYQYRFKPARIGDQDVAVRRVIEIVFKAGS